MYPDPDRPRRFGTLDAVLIALLLGAVVYVWIRVSDVLVYNWDWSFLPAVLFKEDSWAPNLLLEGLLTTIRLSLWAMLLASVLGLVLGVMATLDRLLPRLVAMAYVGLIRNVPPLVFIFVFYFFISSQIIPALGVDAWARNLSDEGGAVMNVLLGPPVILENLISGVLCLAMFEAAYICEIVRAGIRSVPHSQTEAAQSLGLRPVQVFRLVVLPQALRAVTPPMANQFIMLVKNSAIVSLISVQELTFIGTEIAVSTGRRFETWIVVAVMYFILCYGLAWAFARMETRMRRAYTR
ncbi:MAG: amino acid ABC transporter permease [Pseudomonadota bacterium]